MVIAIVGENCVGKSTLAKQISEKMSSKIYSGKDYLRLEKSPQIAEQKFIKMLSDGINGENIIYLVTEKEHLKLLPNGAKIIVMTADLEQIKERFKVRMGGNLPPPVEKMLENRHGIFDNLQCSIKIKSGEYSLESVLKAIK
ncbi:MAG: hypothetical protein IJW64_05455 [Clostridia bacterium]|nr:hypothetical protein [Clostridia bacterium]